MDKIKPLFTATATAVGGRNGHSESSDGIVAVDLSVPKEMGGPGKPGTATPEHLFAAGYAACFGGAIDFVAKQHKKDASKAIVTCAVSIGPREGGGFGLSKIDREAPMTSGKVPRSGVAGGQRESTRVGLDHRSRQMTTLDSRTASAGSARSVRRQRLSRAFAICLAEGSLARFNEASHPPSG